MPISTNYKSNTPNPTNQPKGKTKMYSLDLDPKHKLTATHANEHFTFDEMFGDSISIQPLYWHESFRNSALSTSDDHQDNIARLVSSFHYYNHERNYYELKERAVSLYFNSLGLPFKIVRLDGYSQGDSVVVVLYAEDENWLDSASVDNVRAWWRGDVFNVNLERLVEWKSEYGDTRHEWEIVDSIGCNLLHSNDDLADFIHNFDYQPESELTNA